MHFTLMFVRIIIYVTQPVRLVASVYTFSFLFQQRKLTVLAALRCCQDLPFLWEANKHQAKEDEEIVIANNLNGGCESGVARQPNLLRRCAPRQRRGASYRLFHFFKFFQSKPSFNMNNAWARAQLSKREIRERINEWRRTKEKMWEKKIPGNLQ